MGARQRAALAVSDGSVETPFRSDDTWDYFRRETKSSVTLSKPIGAVLEAADGGVVVAELEEGGSAMSTGSIKKGDRLRWRYPLVSHRK